MRKHLTVANVLALTALFVALSGVAVAATATLTKNQVKAKNVAKQAITTPKLKNGAVTATKLANGSVISVKLANGSVINAKIANGAVTSGKLKNSAVTEQKLASNAVTASKLAADAVTTGKLQAGAVTGEKLTPSFNAQLLKNVSYVDATSLLNTEATKTVTATCPTGKKVTGGGASIVGSTTTVALTQSAPPGDAFAISAPGGPSQWTAKAADVGAEVNPWAVYVFAVCAEP